jgi:WD40 repeat protein
VPESAENEDPLQKVIEQFGSSRLLLFDRDPATRAPTVEVAHEALLREWGRLREWLDESRVDLRMQRVLDNAAADWGEAQRDPSYLLRGARLTQYEAWMESTGLALTQVERDYLNASLAERRAQEAEEAERQAREATLEQRSRRFLRAFVGVLAAASVVAVVLAIIAFNQRGIAEQNALLAGQSAATATVAQGRAQIEAATAVAAQIVAQTAVADEAAQRSAAELEANRRATAQANAEIQQNKAEQLTLLALSRELAAAALNNLDQDPERSVLLALHALSIAHSQEAENTLHNILPSLHLLKTLDAHLNPICDIAVSQDGRHLATADCGQSGAGGEWSAYRTSGRVIVWDLTSYQELLTLRKERGIKSIDFNPNGERLAVVLTRPFINFWDDRWMVWDLVSDRVEYTTYRHEEGAYDYNSITFSPDGSRVATAGSNVFENITHVWDVASGNKLLSLTGHLEESIKGRSWLRGVLDIVYSPDGSRLATGGPDGTARIWDATTGEQLLVLTGHVNEVNQVAFSPDGTHLASAGNDGTVRIWDLNPDQNEGVQINVIIHEEPVWAVAYSPDATRLATGSVDGIARIWDAVSSQILMSLSGQTESISALAFAPDGTRLITASDDTTVKIWDITSGRELFTVTSQYGAIHSVTYSPDGSRLLTSEQDGSVHLWDASTFTKLMTFSNHNNPVARAVFSHDSIRLAIAYEDQTMIVWDSETGKELHTISELPARVLDISFSPEDRLIATATEDGMVRLWDADSGRRLQVLVGHTTEHIHSLTFSPDGSWLVSAGWDGNAIIWDIASGQAMDFIDSDSPTYGVAFSPNGDLLAVSQEDGSTTLWDVSSGDAKEMVKIIGHKSAVTRVAFSPDGEHIATVDLDGITRIWDVEASVAASSGVEVLTLTSHAAGVLDVSFSPDGKRLVTSSLDGTARVYTMDLEELVAIARARLTRTLTEEECQQYLHLDSCPELP